MVGAVCDFLWSKPETYYYKGEKAGGQWTLAGTHPFTRSSAEKCQHSNPGCRLPVSPEIKPENIWDHLHGEEQVS